MYGYGTAVKANATIALKWFESAIRSGEPTAANGKETTIKAINKEKYEEISQEVKNLTNKVTAIIERHNTVSSNTISYSSDSPSANTNSATVATYRNTK